MKCRITITVESALARRINEATDRDRRNRSQQIAMYCEQALQLEHPPNQDETASEYRERILGGGS